MRLRRRLAKDFDDGNPEPARALRHCPKGAESVEAESERREVLLATPYTDGFPFGVLLSRLRGRLWYNGVSRRANKPRTLTRMPKQQNPESSSLTGSGGVFTKTRRKGALSHTLLVLDGEVSRKLDLLRVVGLRIVST